MYIAMYIHGIHMYHVSEVVMLVYKTTLEGSSYIAKYYNIGLMYVYMHDQ